MEERGSSSWDDRGSSSWEVIEKKRKFREDRRKEYDAEKERIWKKHVENHPDPEVIPFFEKPFGSLPSNEIPFFKRSVVSIGLFNGKVMVYTCSGTAVQYLNENIKETNRIFVTTKCLAENYEKNRTSDDNLKVRVRLPDSTIISGFLGLYDNDIAIVTVFSIENVYPVNTKLVEQQLYTDVAKLYAVGRTYGGVLMGASCSSPDFSGAIMSANCAITQAGLGGPVISLDQDGKEHFAGLMVEVPAIETPAEVRVKFLPTKLLDKALQLLTQSVTETTHFRRYSLPNTDIKSVLPAGFKLRSLMLESLGYPLPPPLVFELNGILVNTFEEMFGELHACEGYFWNLYDYGPEKPIWERLGEDVVKNLSRSVVLVSSFKEDNMRCFACTGLLMSRNQSKFVLTSASLFRTGDADCEIEPLLRIEVFLSREETTLGRLKMYHEGLNIAIVRIYDDYFGADFAQDIFKVPKSSKSDEVVAIGRPTKEHEGLLMASKGNMKYRRTKDQRSEFDCKDLKLSTCKIKKVGTGGPLIRLDGSFVGMNFYDESGSTPYLPRSKIVKVLKRGFNLTGPLDLPIRLDMGTEGNAAKKYRWPVPKPYWYLGGNHGLLDEVVGKVPM